MTEYSNTTKFLNSSTHSPDDTSLPIYVGFLFLLLASFLYGSNYVPVKQFETGDGMFFQLIICMGIWLVGFIVNCFRRFPQFYPLPLLGGLLWATGNASSVPIIKTIGMGLGMLIWNVVGLVIGWATPRFGLFGLRQEIPSNVVLNFVGIAFSASSTIFYLFVKTEATEILSKPTDNKISPSGSSDDSKFDLNSIQQLPLVIHETRNFIERQKDSTKRIIGIVLSIISGVLYGQYNTPVLYTNQKFNNGGSYLDMMFSFYSGILFTSFIFFCIYCIAMKNRPSIYPESFLPGLVSGIMWGLATLFYFISTDALNQATSFPIASSGPPIFSSIWSVFLFKEIKGAKNLGILLIGFCFAISGSIMIGLSF